MHTIQLPGRCDRSAATAVHTELRDHLAAGPVTIDGSSVVQIGQSALQVLLSARQSADRAGQKLTVVLSDKMQATLATVGIDTDALAGKECNT